MVRVLAHTTHDPSSNPTIHIFKYHRWALGPLYIKLSIFFLICQQRFYFLIEFFLFDFVNNKPHFLALLDVI